MIHDRQMTRILVVAPYHTENHRPSLHHRQICYLFLPFSLESFLKKKISLLVSGSKMGPKYSFLVSKIANSPGSRRLQIKGNKKI